MSFDKEFELLSKIKGVEEFMNFQPFADEEEMQRILDERDKLIADLEKYPMNQDEKRFVIRRLQVITEKLLEKARYAKDAKSPK